MAKSSKQGPNGDNTTQGKPQPESAPAAEGFKVDGNVIWGVAMLALGYSNAFADSSFALYLVGGAMLAWGAFRSFVPAKQKPPQKAKTGKATAPASEGLRETVESLVVAFILAFLFKSFEAEAFVIPTGSMAPTLLGRHKDVECEQCSFKYTVGASQEIVEGRLDERSRLQTSRCPNCRFPNDVFDLPPFPGDRIIVTKLYDEPRRFDVIVFKYPEEPHVNYIKRCVGMPNETITIRQGDVYSRPEKGAEWQIQRKPDPDKQHVIQMVVYDDRYFPKALSDAGWPDRWAGVQPGESDSSIGGWTDDPDGFVRDRETGHYTAAAGEDSKWLRYRHLVAGASDWKAVLDGANPPAIPRLISDFCGYNMSTPQPDVADHGPYWVGDLTVEFNVNITKANAGGQCMVELIEGDNTYLASFNLDSGIATITQTWEGSTTTLATVETTVKGTGSRSIRFANVDNRISLWVDGRSLDLGEAAYIRTNSEIPTSKDLCPVGVAARNATIDVSDLVLYRDIYYRDETYRSENGYGRVTQTWLEVDRERDMRELLRSPEDWYRAYSAGRHERDLDFGSMVTYELGANEYLMFGDNSPRSQDSRLFPQGARRARRDDFKRFAVPGDAIIGKAFFVYWPHGKPFLNEGKGYAFPASYHVNQDGEAVKDYPNHRVPFVPNVGRMRRIR
ncbi:MAG: signal peptidase I [Planctomycetaceae bacterium]